MDMRPRRAPGGTQHRDGLALADGRTLRHEDPAIVGVARDETLAVRDLDELAVATVGTRVRHHARRHGQQQRFLDLLGDEGRMSADARLQCVFKSGRYAWDWQYNGFVTLPKHFFPQIGNLQSQGEEFECADFIANRLDGVRDWVRNIERKPGAFSLPTSHQRFYPDFLVRMTDGRMLVVEYKGAHLYDNPEQVEKRRIGQLWERRAGERFRFVMPKRKDWGMIRAALGA